MTLRLQTERLIIQPYTHDYLNAYYEEFTDEITKYQYPDSFADEVAAKELVSYFMDEMQQGNMLELVILSKQGEFLGSMEAFSIKEETPEVGLWLKASAHGKGYGYEALKGLIDYLDAQEKYKYYVYEVDQRNKKSIGLVNKFPCKKDVNQEIVTETGKKLSLDTYFIWPKNKNE